MPEQEQVSSFDPAELWEKAKEYLPLNVWTNTFDHIKGDIDQILVEQDELIKQHPDKAEQIGEFALQEMRKVLEANDIPEQEYFKMLDTYDQYNTTFDRSDEEIAAGTRSFDPFTYTKGILRSLGQGVLFGAGDELEAFGTHLFSKALQLNGGDREKAYQDVLFDIQAGMSAFEKANPGFSLSSELVGGFFFPFYGTAIKGARSLVASAAKRPDVVTRSTLGKLGPAGREATAQATVAAPAGTVYSYFKDREVSPLDPVLAGGVSAGFSRGLTKMGETRRAADKRIQISGEGGVEATLGDKLKSKLPNIPAPPDEPPRGPTNILGGDEKGDAWKQAAMREIIQAADDEGVSFEELIARTQKFIDSDLGAEVGMADIVKQRGNIMRTLRGLSTESPQASAAYDQFEQRALDAKKRILPKIFSLFDPTGKVARVAGNNIERFKNKSAEARQRWARPLYEQFGKIELFNPKVTQPDEAQFLGQELMSKITQAMKLDDAEGFFGIKRAWTKATGKLALNDPHLETTIDDQILTGKRFNEFKIQLDGQITKLRADNDFQGASDLTDVKNLFLGYVDRITELKTGAAKGKGVYQRARNRYSGSLALDEAFDFGTKQIKAHKGSTFSADKFEVEFDKLSHSEKAFVRLGMGQAYREALEGDMTEIAPNVRKLILGGAEPNVLTRKLKYAFDKDTTVPEGVSKSGKDRMKDLVKVLNQEGRFKKTMTTLWGGSQSAEKMSEAAGASDKVSDVVETAADLTADAIVSGGNPAWMLARKIPAAFSKKKRRRLVQDKYAGQIADLVMPLGGDKDASVVMQNLKDMQRYKQELDLENVGSLLGVRPYRQIPRGIGRYSLLQPTTAPQVTFPPDVYENR